MGCWVVPAVAAELWGISLDQVMECIRNGTLFWKSEDGFVLVDADPKGAAIVRKAQPKAPHPATFTPVVTKEELAALTEDVQPARNAAAVAVAEPLSEEEQFDWRIARRRVGQTRRAPAA